MLGLFCDLEGRHDGSAGEQSAERGTDLLLGLLASHGLQITFNVVADLCHTQPQRVRRVIDAGHEIACHGWRHERPRRLSPLEIATMLEGAAACFAELGVKPTGFRSPRSDWSTALLRCLPAHGYRWNAERDRAARPYRITPDLVRLPVGTDDWDATEGEWPAAMLIDKWRGHVERAVASRDVVCIGLHEWIVGRREDYAAALDAFLGETRRIAGLRFATLGEIAAR